MKSQQPESGSSLPEVKPAAHISSPARRKFIGKVGGAAAAAATAGAIGFSPILDSAATQADAAPTRPPAGATNPRVVASFVLRLADATKEALIPVPAHTTNGDETLYADKSGTYTKVLLQDSFGKVDLNAYNSMKGAFATGNPSDFENIILGGTRTLNGPQGSLAFGLQGTDAVQFGNATSPANQENNLAIVPPPPAVASAAYGTELVEMHWASLLRDVAFTDYPTNATAIAAAAELNTMPSYAGPKVNGVVTPDVLFRGAYPGNTIGPYISQLFITPTALGAQTMNQQLTSYVAGVDFMADLATWFQVQNGIDTGLRNQVDPTPRYGYDGRVLAAYTHVDVLYQAYFTAFLVLSSLGASLNPGNPYVHSRTQNGFSTFGGPAIAAALGEIAARALDVVWYQKWLVHLRHRPESGGGLVHLTLTNQNNTNATLNSNVLNSQAVQSSFSKYGSYLLSQTFPEGSPAHPAYPTGHGTVGGACVTLLKFFFDGSFVIPNPLVPTNDGLGLVPYTGSDAGQITVGGELNKLAHNVSFGHGIHAGIHWRSDTDSSILLGEALAISFLQDQAARYNEKFTVTFTKLDGTTATISH